MPSSASLLLSFVNIAQLCAGHGFVSGIVSGGVWYPGGDPSNRYKSPLPKVAGWTADNLDNGFVSPDAYTSGDIICHKQATPGQAYVNVKAGDTLQLQWNTFPESHHGPVLNYLAQCSGECTTVDKNTLQFVKIAQNGLVSGSNPGTWATDQLISNNFTGTVKIPASLKPGNYVLRHEILALHSAGQQNGAQNYPQCINLKLTTGGSTTISGGVPATSFYKPTDPGVLFNLYTSFSSYPFPGPALKTFAKRLHPRDFIQMLLE